MNEPTDTKTNAASTDNIPTRPLSSGRWRSDRIGKANAKTRKDEESCEYG
ncbi:MAG: hypothetical protein AAF915_03320 [Cyanobacteria bacterium P01_D01_bin.50]